MRQIRATNSRFERVNNVPCVVVICDDGTEVLMPAEVFLVLSSRARQYLNSTNSPTVAGEWIAARYQSVHQIRTGTTDNGRVALQFDPGTDSEICLSFDPKTARELGQALVDRPMPDGSLGKIH